MLKIYFGHMKTFEMVLMAGLPLITYAPRGRGGGSSLLYISNAYYMQKWGRGSSYHVRLRTWKASNRMFNTLSYTA